MLNFNDNESRGINHMKLKKTTDYAIRVVLYLAEKNDICTAQDIAIKTDVPQNYLNKIIRKLRVAGLIISYQGMNGGYKLIKKAEDVTLLDLIDEFEGMFHIEDTFASMRNSTTIKNMVFVIASVDEIFEKMRERFKQITIEHLLENKSEI